MMDFVKAFELVELNYSDRQANLDISASGVVKSNKFFPLYDFGGDRGLYVFKPLSKTKPNTTGVFAVAEVFWSNIFNEYFCESPVYHPALCRGYTNEVPKYYEYGTVVPYIIQKDEKMVNLLEYFRDNPDIAVDINDYVNYCMKTYDFVPFFKTQLLKERQDLGRSLAMQILCSILRCDQNFHYENVAFICEETGSQENTIDSSNILHMAQMLDHEFSGEFIMPDDIPHNVELMDMICRYLKGMQTDMDTMLHGMRTYETMLQNIRCIMGYCPDVVDGFRRSMHRMVDDICELKSSGMDRFVNAVVGTGLLFPCSSGKYNVGIARYKDNREQDARVLELLIPDVDLEKDAKRILGQAVDSILHMTESMDYAFEKCMSARE